MHVLKVLCLSRHHPLSLSLSIMSVCMSVCLYSGAVCLCGGGEHHPLHHQRAPEPRPGPAHGRTQQPGRRRGALRSQVQHALRGRELLRGRQSGRQRTQGTRRTELQILTEGGWDQGIFKHLRMFSYLLGVLGYSGHPAHSRHHPAFPERPGSGGSDLAAPAVLRNPVGSGPTEQVRVPGTVQAGSTAGPQAAPGEMAEGGQGTKLFLIFKFRTIVHYHLSSQVIFCLYTRYRIKRERFVLLFMINI